MCSYFLSAFLFLSFRTTPSKTWVHFYLPEEQPRSSILPPPTTLPPPPTSSTSLNTHTRLLSFYSKSFSHRLQDVWNLGERLATEEEEIKKRMVSKTIFPPAPQKIKKLKKMDEKNPFFKPTENPF